MNHMQLLVTGTAQDMFQPICSEMGSSIWYYGAARWLALSPCGSRVSEGGIIIQFSFSWSCTSFHSYGDGSAEQIIGHYIAAEKPSKVLSPHILARYCILYQCIAQWALRPWLKRFPIDGIIMLFLHVTGISNTAEFLLTYMQEIVQRTVDSCTVT